MANLSTSLRKGSMMADDRPYVALLAADDWRPMPEYVPSKDYVYLQGYAHRATAPAITVARRGRHELSYWYSPDGAPLSIAASGWKPLPNDGKPLQIWKSLYATPGAPEPYTRPPETVYEPAGVDAKLTPLAADMLRGLRNGAVLHERAWRWTEWRIGAPGMTPVRIGQRAINALRKVAFIERDGVLPPGRLEKWFEFDWKITAAGKAWIEANT